MPELYHVTRDERGRWVFSGSEHDDYTSPHAFRTQPEALDELKRYLSDRGLAVSRVHNHSMGMIVETRPEYRGVRPDITLRTSVFPGLGDLIEELSRDLGKPPAEAIAQALVMLKIVMDAGKAGKRIAITDDDLNVEREILIPGRPDDGG